MTDLAFAGSRKRRDKFCLTPTAKIYFRSCIILPGDKVPRPNSRQSRRRQDD